MGYVNLGIFIVFISFMGFTLLEIFKANYYKITKFYIVFVVVVKIIFDWSSLD
jgi:hypothetical protein